MKTGRLKYYICELVISNGDYRYVETYKLATLGDPHGYLDGVARAFYGAPDEVQDAGAPYYYFNGGAVAVEVGGVQELSLAAFRELGLVKEI